MKDFSVFFLRYLAQHKFSVLAFFLFPLIFIMVFFIYGIDIKAVFYPFLLCGTLTLIFVAFDAAKKYKKHLELNRAINLISVNELPETESIDDADYKKIIENLVNTLALHEEEFCSKSRDLTDYYTVWVHQIKTPIASMQLSLKNGTETDKTKLRSDLNKIEQYVEMVLAYLRLGSDSTDYVFARYDIDEIIKSAVKKFSVDFIGKKLTLEYEPVLMDKVTDEKWLTFVLEQLISNAVKYTKKGSVKIFEAEENVLCIKDTGIGIAKEDLPRIFENGYTGLNGRLDKKASGIGLFLCKRICDNLGIKIYAESAVGEGTAVYLKFLPDEKTPKE